MTARARVTRSRGFGNLRRGLEPAEGAQRIINGDSCGAADRREAWYNRVVFAIVDVETTGGYPGEHRIIEIAVVAYDGTRVVDQFSSLVNPQRAVPPWITKLTGIDDEMVSRAPTFEQIASRVEELTADRVFVAHNARFDYNFVRQEFKAIGREFWRRRLCTLRLSRRVIAGLPSYSLPSLCASLNIRNDHPHRALGDALATLKLFETLQGKFDLEEELREPSLPPHAPREKIAALPEETGVYYLHDRSGRVIFIGRSRNIQQRVIDHFSEELSGKRAIELGQNIRDVSCEVTGSELVARLLQLEEIKRLQPRFNRCWRAGKPEYGLYGVKDEAGRLKLKIRKLRDDPLEAFASRREAYEEFRRLMERARHVGLEQVVGELIFDSPNFVIVGRGRRAEERSVVLVERNRYIGFGYVQECDGLDGLRACVRPRPHDWDAVRAIRSYLKKNPADRVIRFEA